MYASTLPGDVKYICLVMLCLDEISYHIFFLQLSGAC